MRRIKDYFFNLFLEIRLSLWFIFGFTIKRFWVGGNTLFPTPGSAIVEWRDGMPWGRVHKDYDHQIMTGESVREISEGLGIGKKLVLFHLPYTKPYTFPAGEREGEVVYPRIDSGCIFYRQPFKYGAFQITCKLPASNSAWPAFWLYGKKDWPPEIDWFEFMPGNMNRNGRFKMSTNSHTGSEKIHKQKSRAYRLAHAKLGKEITVSGVWTPEKIEWYYEGILIRRITEKDSLKGMNQEQWLVIGTGGMADFKDDLLVSTFEISEVKYQRLEYDPS